MMNGCEVLNILVRVVSVFGERIVVSKFFDSVDVMRMEQHMPLSITIEAECANFAERRKPIDLDYPPPMICEKLEPSYINSNEPWYVQASRKGGSKNKKRYY